MHFLIATAALFSALVIAKPVDVDVLKVRAGYAGCRIIGDCDVPVRECASMDCAETGVYYSPGDWIYFSCYVEGPMVTNDADISNIIESIYWDNNEDGYFPEAYVEVLCAETIDLVCATV